MSFDWSSCAFKRGHDPLTLEPIGRECGEPAVEIIHWRDGRMSPACRIHGLLALTPDARRLVAKVTPK